LVHLSLPLEPIPAGYCLSPSTTQSKNVFPQPYLKKMGSMMQWAGVGCWVLGLGQGQLALRQLQVPRQPVAEGTATF